MIRAAIYARISDDRDDTKLGVSRQVEDCELLARQKDWTVVRTLIDNDISAFSGKRRPSYEALLDDIRDGQVEAVVVWHLDRLHRQPKELEEFIDLCEAKRVLLASVSGRVDLGTPEGRLHARILGAVARMESEHKSRRIRRKMEELAQSGKPKGGKRPYGYEADQMTVRESEADIIRESAERILSGVSLLAICADLNERGVPTATGKRWETSLMRQILRSARIKGERLYRGEVVGPAAWPAIVTPKVGKRLDLLFRSRARGPQPVRRNLLTGLLQCGVCGTRLVGRPRGETRMYVCPSGTYYRGCGRVGRRAQPIEDLITDAVLYRIDTPEVARSLGQRGSGVDDATVLSIEDDQQRLTELASAYAARGITMVEWMTARKPIEERIATAQKQLAQSRTRSLIPVENGESIRRRWGQLDLGRKRAVISSLLDHAIVHPVQFKGRREFDPTRIEPVWLV